MADKTVRLFSAEQMSGNLDRLAERRNYLAKSDHWRWEDVEMYLLSAAEYQVTGVELMRIVCDAFKVEISQLSPNALSGELFIQVLEAVAPDDMLNVRSGVIAYIQTKC